MTQSQTKEWLKREIPIDEAYKIITGVDPCKGLRSGTHEFNTHSIFGKGEDKRPSMSLNIEKGLFHCHRTGFGGDIFNLISGQRTIPPRDFAKIVKTLKSYVLNRRTGQHQTIKIKASEAPTTNHLISQGIPKAWKYFRASMRAGYGANPKIKQTIELYMKPKNHHISDKDIDMGPIHDYVATEFGWCDLSNALVIPYGLNGVEMMELVFFVDGNKNIGAYPFKTHRASQAFQKIHTVNGDHSFFSGTEGRPDVELKPWPAGIGLETPPAIDDIYGTGAQGHEIVICEGVKDAIMARYHGFYSVAHHGGTSQLKKISNVHNLFLDEDGTERPTYAYICMDSDPIGEKGAIMCRGAFRGRQNMPYIVDVGHQGTRGDGYDLHDFFTDGFTGDMLKMYFKRARIANESWGIR
jgi:hypothetical protein